jgi:lysophospholipase L1-like esterase
MGIGIGIGIALGLGGGKASFVPSDLTGQIRWLRGDNAGTGAITSWAATTGVSLSSGTGTAAASYANGRKAVTFDGAAQRLSEVTSTDLGTAATAFTMSAVLSLDYQTTILAGKDNGAWFQHGSQVIYFQIVSGQYAQLAFNIGYTGVVRIVARYDGTAGTDATKLRLWVDGVERAPTYTGGMPANVSLTNGFHAGGIPSLGFFSLGAVLDVSSWNTAKTAGEIAQLAGWQAATFAPRMALVIGDSIQVGQSLVTPRLAPPNVLAGLTGVRNNGCDIRTCAVAGYTLADIKTYFDTHGAPWLLDTNQSKRSVIITAGTNDLGTTGINVSSATALARLDTLIAACRAAGATHVYVAHLLPRKDSGLAITSAAFDVLRGEYLTGLTARLGGSGIDAILRPDLSADLTDPDNVTYYQDKIHPTAAGSISFAVKILADLGGSMLPQGNMATITAAFAWAQAHPVEFWGGFWIVFSGTLNTILRIWSARAIITYCERSPPLAFLIGLLRGWGFDPAAALVWAARAAAAKAAGAGLSALFVADNGPPTPRNDGRGGGQ